VLFLGTFDYAMDERGRVPLPPKFRDAFRAGVVLSQGSPDRCVRVYTADAFEAQASQFLAVPSFRSKGRDLRRMFSRTWETQLDAQNRVLIPGSLRSFAGLDSKVMVVGAGEWLEVWSPGAYEADMERIEATLEITLESIEERR
jgi:MraZ protein